MPITIPDAKIESDFSRGLTKLLRDEARAEVLALVGGQKQTGGWPDRYISHPQFAGFIEVKCDDYGLDTRQQSIIENLNRNHACTAFVLICSRKQPMHAMWLVWPSCNMQVGVFNKVSSDTWMKQDIAMCTDVVVLLKMCGQIQSEEREMHSRMRRLLLHKQVFNNGEQNTNSTSANKETDMCEYGDVSKVNAALIDAGIKKRRNAAALGGLIAGFFLGFNFGFGLMYAIAWFTMP